jgi:ferredoxin-NADP reductase
VLIAGGTGVTPFVPFLESLWTNNSRLSIEAILEGGRQKDYPIFYISAFPSHDQGFQEVLVGQPHN